VQGDAGAAHVGGHVAVVAIGEDAGDILEAGAEEVGVVDPRLARPVVVPGRGDAAAEAMDANDAGGVLVKLSLGPETLLMMASRSLPPLICALLAYSAFVLFYFSLSSSHFHDKIPLRSVLHLNG
jgi:hypothetical protein